MRELYEVAGIYSITNIDNGKRYIGRTIDLHKREITHFWMLKNNRHPNCHLQRAFNEGQQFRFEVVEICNADALNDREIYWINEFNAFGSGGYNQCAGGAATLGRVITEETKLKISEKAKGRKRSEATIARARDTLKRRLEDDPEFCERYYESMRQRAKHPAWNKGRPHTEEEKKNLSEKLKGRNVSESHRNKLRSLYAGEGSTSSKLKKSEVIDIKLRFLYGESQRSISKDYPVTPQTIYDIVHGRRWKCVPDTKEELEEMKWKISNLDPKE